MGSLAQCGTTLRSAIQRRRIGLTKPFLQCSWTFDTEAWAFSIPTGNFHFVRASVPERLALPASNVAVGSVFNLDFPILYVLHGNKELTLSCNNESLLPLLTVINSLGPKKNYPKFCIGFKIRKSRCRTTLTLRFGLLKMVFECSIACVMWYWVEQWSIVKEIHSGSQKYQETGQFCRTIFQG